ncbi:MAG TPA: alpha/beta hydrolase [Solirubrobacteraceae bacterium]
MRLRLYHHHDGARVAYREAGTGPPLALLHSPLLSHREWEPLVGELSDRFRLVLPDLPLHGDSEDRPAHSYTPDWLAEVVAGFCREVCGPRPLVGGHDASAQLLLRAVGAGWLQPSRLVLMSSALHRRPARPRARRLLELTVRPAAAEMLSARGNAAARDLGRHAFSSLTRRRARARLRALRRARGADPVDLLDAYRCIDAPTLLLWADEDQLHPLAIAEEALELIADAQLRVLPQTGFLMAYDDPVGLARELAAFCV